jgi:hypothetical protein
MPAPLPIFPADRTYLGDTAFVKEAVAFPQVTIMKNPSEF